MRRFFVTVTALMLLLSLFTVGVNAKVFSGKALDEDYIRGGSGDGEVSRNYQIQYELDSDTGVLRIFCDPDHYPQKMLSYAEANYVPWIRSTAQRNAVRTVVIEEGVQSIGHYSFLNCRFLEEVWMPASVGRVDRRVFDGCISLKVIHYAGTKDDFDRFVKWTDAHNEYTDPETDKTVVVKDLVEFGEHVMITCQLDDGYVFARYPHGGYAVGDAYEIAPPVYDGLTLVSDASVVTGTFQKHDKTEYYYTYHCDHQFVHYNDKPCADACKFCGMPAEDAAPHTWEINVLQERGLFTEYKAQQVCSVCGAYENLDNKFAYILPIGIVAGAILVIGAITVPVLLHVRHSRKQQKEQPEEEN